MKLAIAPENLEVANTYLTTGSLAETAKAMRISLEKVSTILGKADVRRYVDNIYMDSGYRNRHKLASLMDTIIEKKLEEAEDSEIYSNKDLVDILAIMHKMKMDEIKSMNENIKNQTNIQVNNTQFGDGKYGDLMSKLLGAEKIVETTSREVDDDD